VLKHQTLISYVSVVIIQKVIVTVKKPLVMTGEMDLRTTMILAKIIIYTKGVKRYRKEL
jgi:hypothetical protein